MNVGGSPGTGPWAGTVIDWQEVSGAPLSGRNGPVQPHSAQLMYTALRDLLSTPMPSDRSIPCVAENRPAWADESCPTIGKYLLGPELGRGGMGTVRQGYDTVLDRRVAIKELEFAPNSEGDQRRRFAQEARSIARLHHPNVVQVYDHGVRESGNLYSVMELLEGEDLGARLRRTPKMPPSVVATVISQLSEGLQAAHDAGIVHRDIKPANIFLCGNASRMQVKLLDFGAASLRSPTEEVNQSLTAANVILGSPPYMSPEQADAQPVDLRTDLWSLGIVAYQALTGNSPFLRTGPMSTLFAVTSEDAPAPSSIDPDLAPFDAFFQRALAKQASDRFQSAHELTQAFYLCTAPGSASKPSVLLVVDDEPDLQMLIEGLFEDEIENDEYIFEFALDGHEALRKVETLDRISAVITDLNMPGMDGLSFLARLQQISPHIPAVVLTAYSDMKNIRKAMNRAAYDFLCKPIDVDDLKQTVQKMCRLTHRLEAGRHYAEENSMLRAFVDPQLAKSTRLWHARPENSPIRRAQGSILRVGIRGHQSLNRAGLSDNEQRRTLNQTLDRVVEKLLLHSALIVQINDRGIIAVVIEPDAERRACEAALDMCAAFDLDADAKVPLSIAVGIGTSHLQLTVVGAPNAGRFGFCAIGEALEAALRSERVASDFEVIIDSATARSIAPIARSEIAQGTAHRLNPAMRSLLCDPELPTHPVVFDTAEMPGPSADKPRGKTNESCSR